MEELNLVEVELLIKALSSYILRFPNADDFEETTKLLEKLEQMKEHFLKSDFSL